MYGAAIVIWDRLVASLREAANTQPLTYPALVPIAATTWDSRAHSPGDNSETGWSVTEPN